MRRKCQEIFSVILSEKNHIPELGSAVMTFTPHRTLGATILVSNLTSAHTKIYSKHVLQRIQFLRQTMLFWTSILYYSRPLPTSNCPLCPRLMLNSVLEFSQSTPLISTVLRSISQTFKFYCVIFFYKLMKYCDMDMIDLFNF